MTDDRDDLEDVRARDAYACEEWQARLAEEIEQGRAEVERRRAERLATPPPPDWSQYRDLNSMDQRTYSTWIDAGKPALGQTPPPPPQRKGDFSAEGDIILKAVGQLLADTHVEMARRDAANRADAANREGVVRGQVEEIRQEVFRTADRLRSELRDNMAGAANRLLTLREEREASQHDLQKQIITLQRELFELRQVLAGERSKANGLDHDTRLLSN